MSVHVRDRWMPIGASGGILIIKTIMTPELIIAIEACLKAGRAIARHDCRVPVHVGGDDEGYAPDDAGMESHQLITQTLSVTGLPILSEHGERVPYEVRSGWQQFWLVSPLDNVDEFMDCSGEYTVSVALVEGHEPVLGVVYAPARDELFCASRESGAFRIRDASSAIADTRRLLRSSGSGEFFGPRSCRILVSRSCNEEKVLSYMDDPGKGYLKIDVVPKGGAMKLCQIAAGDADIYPCLEATLEWETAAGHAILKAVGMSVLDIRTGEELSYNKPELLNPGFIAK